MYEKLEKCPSCSHTLFLNFRICTDYSVSQESFALVKCDKCQLVFTNPRPDEKKILDYYKSENYISHTNNSNNIINFIYKLVRNYTLHSKYQLIRKYKKGNRLLDYGSGTGHFLKYMDKKGWDCTGYEPYLKTNHPTGITIVKTKDQLKKIDKFHVITAWHVIEHVHDLQGTLKLLRKRLNTGGYLFIAVPNINSFDAKKYDQYWAAYDVPRHLYHFSQASFRSLATKNKLTIVKTIPMKFDAYYVSWLSEKYKGSSNMLRAFKLAYQSNNYAKHTTEYSSLIYVLKA